MDRDWAAVDDYIAEKLVGADQPQAALEANAAAGLPAIDVSPAQGKFLYLLAKSCAATRILEVGTLGGYSTIWLARALPAGGRLVTLEIDPHHAEVARRNLAEAGVADRVEVRVGPALDSLAALAKVRSGAFDLVFIDADKEHNADYVDAAIGLARPGALIVVDNVVRNGGVIDSPLLNGNGNALPQLMQNENLDTYVASAFDSGVTALNYLLARFGTVDEADGTAPTPGSSYDVFIPAPGDGAFLHTTAPGSQAGFATLIDNPYTNAHGERIVLATHRATPLFNHPLGVVFAFDVWFIAQLDAQGGDPAFPNGLAFHVYAQDPSLNAFVWTAPDAGTATAIDHVLLNGEPCGRLHVANGNLNPHPVDVVYEQNRWTITNTDGGAMPAGAQFNVVVDEAAIEFCRYDHIFHDGVGG